MELSPRVFSRWKPRPRAWWRVLSTVFWRLQQHESMLVAAGCAFYATLSLFPALTMLLSLYGLLFDPASVEPQLQLLSGLLPPDAVKLITQQVHTLLSHRGQGLGISLVISALFTWWSASSATTSIISAMNQAYETVEQRGYVRFLFVSLVLTLAATLCAILALAFLVALPAVANFFTFLRRSQALIHDASVAVLVAYVAGLIAGLYRFGPCIRPGRHHRILPGTVVATVLWLGSALLFTVYVQRIASFDATYGPLAAVAGVMLWFWLSIYAALAGAELNSTIEMRAKTPEKVSG